LERCANREVEVPFCTNLSYVQGIVDKTGQSGQFILTGSHQPRLHEAISQSLAGRTAMLTLWPFSLSELRHYDASWSAFDLIVRGCFPRLHEENLTPRRFYNAYVQTYVERDVRLLIQLKNLTQFQQFLMLLAGRVRRFPLILSKGWKGFEPWQATLSPQELSCTTETKSFLSAECVFSIRCAFLTSGNR